jgi:hypothetical protein
MVFVEVPYRTDRFVLVVQNESDFLIRRTQHRRLNPPSLEKFELKRSLHR